MSDMQSGAAVPQAQAVRAPFPVARLLYSVLFAVVAHFIFLLLLVVTLLQYASFAIEGRLSADIRTFSVSLMKYLVELLAYICFVRDEPPFPIGPFPKA